MLARLSGDDDNREREERRQAQVDCARLVLQRSSALLLTSSRTFLRQPDCVSARENRDTVFCQMRRALDLIHFIVKEGVVDCAVGCGLEAVDPISNEEHDRAFFDSTVLKSIQQFDDSVDIMRVSSAISDGYKDQLTSSLAAIAERTQDFTDSAYTSHEHRQNILLQCDRARVELAHLLRSMSDSEGGTAASVAAPGLLGMSPPLPPPVEVEAAMRSLGKATAELRLELRETAAENSAALLDSCRRGSELLGALKDAALMADLDRVQLQSERFSEHIDYVEDVSKLVRHVVRSESAQTRAKHAQVNLHIYGPQVGVAAVTLCKDARSGLALENFDMFCAMWQHLVDDVVQIAREAHLKTLPVILQQPPTPGHDNPPPSPYHSLHGGGGGSGSQFDVNMLSPSPTHHLPLPLPPGGVAPLGKFNKSVPNLSSNAPTASRGGGGDGGDNRFLDPTKIPTQHQHQQHQQQQHDPYPFDPYRRHSTSSVMPGQPGQYPQQQQQQPMHSGRPEDVLDSFKDVENNEIVNRAKKMTGHANDMVDFTRGRSSKVKTTQDFFTVAEYFAEETNAVYKVIRIFSYDVPAGEDKRSLMAIADRVPKHCNGLQTLIHGSTVGKAATFTKVDSIVKATRPIVQLIVRVVQICFANANKYGLDFSHITLESSRTAGLHGTSDEAFGGSSGGGGGGGGGSAGASSGTDSS